MGHHPEPPRRAGARPVRTGVALAPLVLLVGVVLPGRAAAAPGDAVPVPLPLGAITSVVTAPEGDVWYVRRSSDGMVDDQLGRLTPAGAVTEDALPDDPGYSLVLSRPGGATARLGMRASQLVADPDGAGVLLAMELGRLGRADATAAVTYGPRPAGGFHFVPTPDGALWYLGGENSRVVHRVPPGQDVMTGAPVAAVPRTPLQVGAGPDDAFWYDSIFSTAPPHTGENVIGRVTAAGAVAEFPLPAQSAGVLADVRGGAVWALTQGALVRVSTV